jgi:hypothetical protein
MAVKLVPLPAAELIGDRLTRGEYAAAVLPFAIGLDPDLYPLLAASQTRTGGSNVIDLQDPDLDKLLVAARSRDRQPRPSLDIEVIAEGIESSAQSAVLADLGCLWGQGFYYSPPLPAAEISEQLRSRAVAP